MDVTTLGIRVGYAVASVKGTAPSIGYTELHRIKDIPAIGSAPESIDDTSLNETKFKKYLLGLMDTGGALELKFFNSDTHQTEWNNCLTAHSNDVSGSKKGMWFMFWIPELANAFYVEGVPASLGFAGASVNNALESSAYITLTDIKGWDSKGFLNDITSDLTGTVAEGSASGTTKVTLSSAGAGFSYVVKTTTTAPVYMEDLSSWTAYTSGSNYTITDGTQFIIAKVNSSNKAVQYGIFTADSAT